LTTQFTQLHRRRTERVYYFGLYARAYFVV
jgi:hypothetical protein